MIIVKYPRMTIIFIETRIIRGMLISSHKDKHQNGGLSTSLPK
jgi:hypothetical protein